MIAIFVLYKLLIFGPEFEETLPALWVITGVTVKNVKQYDIDFFIVCVSSKIDTLIKSVH